MKQIFSKIIIIAMAVFAGNCSAQSLEELISTALQNNYQIRILKNEAVIASNNNTRGNAGQLPTVDLNGNYSISYNNTKQEFSDGTTREGSNSKNNNINLEALANWTIFNGFSVYAKKDQLEYLEELGQLNSKYYIEQTVSDIVTIYYQLIYEKQLLKNFRQSLDISSFRLTLENKRKEIGAGKIIDYGQALVDYQTDSIRLLSQQSRIKSLNIEMNRILNNDLDNELNIADSEFVILELPSKDTLFSRVVQNNSELSQQRLRELIAETQLRIEKANRYPKVDFVAGYRFTKSFSEVGFFKSNQNYGPTIGVNVSFNLFNGGETNRIIKNTKIYAENSELTKKEVNQNLNAEVLDLYSQHISINERIVLAKNNVETIKKVYRAAKQQLSQGAINGYDFRLTQLKLLTSELSLTQLQFSLKAVEINLNRLTGSVVTTYM